MRWTASEPGWQSSSIEVVERVVGAPVECYPRNAYTSTTVQRWHREGGQLDVVYDTIDLGGLLSDLRCLDAVEVDDEMSPTAADARRLLATRVREQLDWLQREPWEDGTTTRGSQIGWPRCFAARNVPPILTPDDEVLLQRYPDCFDWPQSEAAALELWPLLGTLQVWRDESGDYADHSNPAVHDAVTRVHRYVHHSISRWDPEGAVQDAEPWVRRCEVKGPWDRRYINTVDFEAKGDDAPRRRALRAKFADSLHDRLIFGTDPWQHLVAYYRGDDDSPEKFAVEWPLRPVSDPVPDDAELVADGPGSDRPVYILLPYDRMALLPAYPAAKRDWNFGFTGAGPAVLVEVIVHFFTLVDALDRAAVPVEWIGKQVRGSDRAELRILVRDIRSRYSI